MSEIKLLPCPFCEGKKVISTYNNFVPALLCGSCGAMMTIPMSFGDTYEDKEAELLRKWNTRKPMQDIMEKLENESRYSEEAKEYARVNNPLQFERCDSYLSAIDNAIEIVREVGWNEWID